MKKKNPTKREAKKMRLEFDPRLLENEVWLTNQQITTHLNISRSTLYRLRKKHNIPSFKLGGTPIYPKHLLNKLFLRKAMGNVDEK